MVQQNYFLNLAKFLNI